MPDFFTEREISCKCGCGKIIKNEDLINKLTAARIISNVSYQITSWTRCHDHNKSVGGTTKSEHLTGDAVDIYVTNSFTRFMIMYGLILAGFERVGVGKDFIHAGIGKSKPSPCVYLYS